MCVCLCVDVYDAMHLCDAFYYSVFSGAAAPAAADAVDAVQTLLLLLEREHVAREKWHCL